jgi:phosphate/sulfate permease
MHRRDLDRPDCRHRHEEAVITAIIAAVLFAIALVLHLAGLSLGPLDSTFFMLGGLIAAALHLAGIGTAYRGRVRR